MTPDFGLAEALDTPSDIQQKDDYAQQNLNIAQNMQANAAAQQAKELQARGQINQFLQNAANEADQNQAPDREKVRDYAQQNILGKIKADLLANGGEAEQYLLFGGGNEKMQKYEDDFINSKPVQNGINNRGVVAQTMKDMVDPKVVMRDTPQTYADGTTKTVPMAQAITDYQNGKIPKLNYGGTFDNVVPDVHQLADIPVTAQRDKNGNWIQQYVPTNAYKAALGQMLGSQADAEQLFNAHKDVVTQPDNPDMTVFPQRDNRNQVLERELEQQRINDEEAKSGSTQSAKEVYLMPTKTQGQMQLDNTVLPHYLSALGFTPTGNKDDNGNPEYSDNAVGNRQFAYQDAQGNVKYFTPKNYNATVQPDNLFTSRTMPDGKNHGFLSVTLTNPDLSNMSKAEQDRHYVGKDADGKPQYQFFSDINKAPEQNMEKFAQDIKIQKTPEQSSEFPQGNITQAQTTIAKPPYDITVYPANIQDQITQYYDKYGIYPPQDQLPQQ